MSCCNYNLIMVEFYDPQCSLTLQGMNFWIELKNEGGSIERALHEFSCVFIQTLLGLQASTLPCKPSKWLLDQDFAEVITFYGL